MELKGHDFHRSTPTADSPDILSIQSQTPPINRLPFEVFQIIITLSQEGATRTFPFILSRISRLWREYVLAMPLLWNSLHISQRVPQWEMLQAKLERSGQAPLAIYLDRPPFMKSVIPHLRRIMRMIIPCIERWRSLHLTNIPHKIKRILLDHIKTKSAPRLEQVHVFHRSYPRVIHTSPGWSGKSVFAGFPNLKSVEWTSPLSSVEVIPSFKNLTRLTVGDGTLDGVGPLPFIQLVRRLLSDSPLLETLAIQQYPSHSWDQEDDVDEIHAQFPVLTHHSLRTLSIMCSEQARSATIRSLVLPSLRTFSATCHSDAIDLSGCDIIARENNLPELRVISITGERASGPSFRSHMRLLLPTIQNLANLSILTFTDLDFGNGEWLPDLGTSCPRLRWLLFIYCVGFTTSSIRQLVEARIQGDGINPLEILGIEPGWWAPPECSVEEEDAA